MSTEADVTVSLFPVSNQFRVKRAGDGELTGNLIEGELTDENLGKAVRMILSPEFEGPVLLTRPVTAK